MSARKPLSALALTGLGSALVVAYRVPSDAAPVANLGRMQAAGAATGAYRDGTYLGTAVPEPWGTFQVQATISGGRLTDVALVQGPGDGHSSRINGAVVPMLTRAAIAAQGATMDLVSGATWTSESYATSLQAALDAATRAVDGGVAAEGAGEAHAARLHEDGGDDEDEESESTVCRKPDGRPTRQRN